MTTSEQESPGSDAPGSLVFTACRFFRSQESRGRREHEGEPRTLHAAVSLTLFRNTPQLVYTLPGESLNKLLASFRTREISTPRIAATIDFKRLRRATSHSRDWMTLRMASGKPPRAAREWYKALAADCMA